MTDQKTWAPAEIAALRDAFADGKSRTEIARAMGRSVGSIRAKILSLGLRRGVKPWSDTEITELKRLHGTELPVAGIAEALGRSLDAVTTMCHRLELKRMTNACPWTCEQVERLKTLVDEGMSLGRIAEVIGHPRSSVADKLRQLGLTSAKFRQPWTAEELHLMDALHADGASLAEIAERMPGRSPHAIRLKLDKQLKRHPGQFPGSAPILLAPGAGLRLPTAAGAAPRPQVFIPASVTEMERWLRTRDYIVLHRPDGWIVDRHHLKDEDALIEFVNVRRQRHGLPLFAKYGAMPEPVAAPRAPAPGGWRRAWQGPRVRARVSA
ncbi:MAG TPA: SANT/Myb-like DNA-binding domain-containing protein [Azospirillaceae bacterium]|nr:SANT/Myb-like DNA-binding domain-containing protein [Azospirillaceae bacterium]